MDEMWCGGGAKGGGWGELIDLCRTFSLHCVEDPKYKDMSISQASLYKKNSGH